MKYLILLDPQCPQLARFAQSEAGQNEVFDSADAAFTEALTYKSVDAHVVQLLEKED